MALEERFKGGHVLDRAVSARIGSVGSDFVDQYQVAELTVLHPKLRKEVVIGDIPDDSDGVSTGVKLDDPIHQQERLVMRNDLLYGRPAQKQPFTPGAAG